MQLNLVESKECQWLLYQCVPEKYPKVSSFIVPHHQDQSYFSDSIPSSIPSSTKTNCFFLSDELHKDTKDGVSCQYLQHFRLCFCFSSLYSCVLASNFLAKVFVVACRINLSCSISPFPPAFLHNSRTHLDGLLGGHR